METNRHTSLYHKHTSLNSTTNKVTVSELILHIAHYILHDRWQRRTSNTIALTPAMHILRYDAHKAVHPTRLCAPANCAILAHLTRSAHPHIGVFPMYTQSRTSQLCRSENVLTSRQHRKRWWSKSLLVNTYPSKTFWTSRKRSQVANVLHVSVCASCSDTQRTNENVKK